MSTPRYKIGFTTLTEQQPFSHIVRETFLKAASVYPELEVISRDNNLNNECAMANVQEFASLPVDLAIIYHVDERFNPRLNRVLMRCQIPVVAIDIPIPMTTYFGVNNKEAGMVAGEEIGKWVQTYWDGYLDKVLVVTDSRVLDVVQQRLKYAIKGLAKYAEFDPDHIFFMDGENSRKVSRDRSLVVLRNWSDYHQIAIIGLNDEAVLGALDAAYTLGRAKDVIGIGQSAVLLDEGFSQAEGRFIGSVAFFPEQYGPKLLDLSLRILVGEKVPHENYIEHVCITREKLHPWRQTGS